MTGPVLVIAAHPDDEVLGCGGTIAKWASEGREVHVLLMADGEGARIHLNYHTASIAAGRVAERFKAAQDACSLLGAEVRLLTFRDNCMDGADLLDVVRPIEEYVAKIRPTTVLTHHAGDVNQDHRVVHQAVAIACRPQPSHSVRELLFFEVPSSTEWQVSGAPFVPNYFVDITETRAVKMRALECYDAEMRPFPHARSRIAVGAIGEWRGATVGYRAAEAFMVGRVLA